MPQSKKVKVYQAVTADKFNLIVRQTDTAKELAKLLSKNERTIFKLLKTKSNCSVDGVVCYLEKFIIIINNNKPTKKK